MVTGLSQPQGDPHMVYDTLNNTKYIVPASDFLPQFILHCRRWGCLRMHADAVPAGGESEGRLWVLMLSQHTVTRPLLAKGEQMHVLRIRYFCLLAILLSTSNVWAYTPIPQSPMAQRVHPRLHLTPETIPALRNAIAAHYVARFQSYVDWTITETIRNEQDKFNIISDAA